MARSVEVTFGDQTKQLRYDFNAIADLEERFGKGVGAIFTEEQLGFRSLRLLYWAGLKWRDPGLTEQRVGNMLAQKMEQGDSLQDLFQPVVQALKLSGLINESDDEIGSEEPAKN